MRRSSVFVMPKEDPSREPFAKRANAPDAKGADASAATANAVALDRRRIAALPP